jgi:hypothetical protein
MLLFLILLTETLKFFPFQSYLLKFVKKNEYSAGISGQFRAISREFVLFRANSLDEFRRIRDFFGGFILFAQTYKF